MTKIEYVCTYVYVLQQDEVPRQWAYLSTTEREPSRLMCLKKNQSTSEHPPVMGEKMSKRFCPYFVMLDSALGKAKSAEEKEVCLSGLVNIGGSNIGRLKRRVPNNST